jgi:hypothetical protein
LTKRALSFISQIIKLPSLLKKIEASARAVTRMSRPTITHPREAIHATLACIAHNKHKERGFCTTLWTCGAYPGPRLIGDSCHFVSGVHSPRRLNGTNCPSGSLSRLFTGDAVGRHGHTPFFRAPRLSLLSPAKSCTARSAMDGIGSFTELLGRVSSSLH